MKHTLTVQLALRYLRGKGSANAVPILSRISMVAIAVCTGAMIVVFSVFNGLESVVTDIYNSFYPEIKITVARGKFFPMDPAKLAEIRKVSGVQHLCTVIEDNVFANHADQQKVIMLKGIENDYFDVNDVRQYITLGDTVVSSGNPNTAIMGMHIYNELGADINTPGYVMFNYPNPDVTNPGDDPLSAFQTLKLHPAGVFHIQDDFDNTYVMAPLSLVQELFHRKGQYSSIEISADRDRSENIKKHLQTLLGTGFRVETRYEQNKTMYLVMGAERWAIRAILLLVLLIASFNMVGALSMLVLEKQKDIAILHAMGAGPSAIRKIFLAEGVLWSLTGGISGIALGGAICIAQQKFGLLKMGGSFLPDAFPVKLVWTDFALVTGIIIIVGLLAAWYPAARAAKVMDPSLKAV